MEAYATESGRFFAKEGRTVKAKVSSDYNKKKLGTFTATYSFGHFWDRVTVEQIIIVQDTTSPEISLVSDPDYKLQPGETYEEEGYTAYDLYDGDLTENVTTEEVDNKVIYHVTDSSGNETTTTRDLPYIDSEAPVITLTGGDTMSLPVGSEFKDPGYTASDNTDGDLTDAVTVTGSVDTSTAGEYTLTYTATDSFGNVATVTRTVIVASLGAVSPDSGDKVIYLTFDDGPGPYTAQLLDILAKYGVKATFFTVNNPDYNYLMTREHEEGHTVAVHSYTHAYDVIYASEDAFYDDFYKMQDVIKEYTGVTTTIFRFPGGSSNTVSRKYCDGLMTALALSSASRGLTYFDWNVTSGDAGETTETSVVVSNVINGIQNNHPAVILQHDIKKFSVDAVEQIILWGLENGYTFKAITPETPVVHHRVNN